MKQDRITYIKNIVFPCVLFSAVTGILTGGLIFAFRWAASAVSDLSGTVYAFVRAHPVWLPLFLVGAAALGVLSWLLLKFVPDCRGGGIPTAIGQLRGLLPFRWLRSLLSVFASAMVTYLCGIPLGTEGPSVQMGTAMGRGAVRLFGRNHPAWDRYVMTGGACAGFAAATGAPLTGILFAFEEAHRRFSPMIFMVSAMTVASGSVTTKFLYEISGSHWDMFVFAPDTVLPIRSFWAPLVVGLICGLFAVLFTKTYGWFGGLLRKISKIPLSVKVIGVFVLVAGIGFFSHHSVGSGHHLIESVFAGEEIWQSLLLLLCVRTILLIVSNNIGITGGLFVPSLAFGAILGALCGKVLIFSGLLPEEYYGILVIVGTASFLGASSRIPLTAIAFALEALSGMSNLIPVVLGVALAYVVIEIFGIVGFSDAVLEHKIDAARSGRVLQTVDKEFTVRPDSFVIGKEVRDILWPPSCIVLSVDRNPAAARGSGEISEGDVLHLHYQTCDDTATMEDIEALVGVQTKD